MHRAAVRRNGRDLTIVSYSRHAVLAQEAAVELAKEGIEAEVIDLRSLKPIDWEPAPRALEKTAPGSWSSRKIAGLPVPVRRSLRP